MHDFCVKKIRGKPRGGLLPLSLLLCTKRTFCKQKGAFYAERRAFLRLIGAKREIPANLANPLDKPCGLWYNLGVGKRRKLFSPRLIPRLPGLTMSGISRWGNGR